MSNTNNISVSPQSLAVAFDGRNSDLKQDNYCRSCSAVKIDQHAALLRCSRCKLVYYCSRDCQKKDFSQHKACCKRIETLAKATEEEYARLKARRNKAGMEYFVQMVGFFGSFLETMKYLSLRAFLGGEILNSIAWNYETKEAWEAVLRSYQEVLRLDSLDKHVQLRFRFPFLLLSLNRDDDAFHFCRIWCAFETSERRDLHTGSKEGDWVYGHAQDCRYLDFFAECSPKDPSDMPVPMLLAVAIIKLRIVIAYEVHKQGMEVFQQTSAGATIDSLVPLVSAMCLGDDQFIPKMEAQRPELYRILDQIHAMNSFILLSMLNAVPVRTIVDPGLKQEGQPWEEFVTNISGRMWNRIPGGKELLQARYG